MKLTDHFQSFFHHFVYGVGREKSLSLAYEHCNFQLKFKLVFFIAPEFAKRHATRRVLHTRFYYFRAG